VPARRRRIHAYHFAGEAVRQAVERAFPDREYVVFPDAEGFLAGIGEVEVLLALQPPRGHWQEARQLRFIQMSGAGVDSLLPAPDLPAGVRLANARGVHEPEMPEFVVAMVLALAKRLPQAVAQQARREWRMFAGRRLAGSTVGILGLGAIGQSVARRLAALGMRVIGTRRGGAPLDGVDAVYGPDETDAVLLEAQVLVVLLPLTPETRGLLDARALALLPPRALLVNVARGGIVDEVALAAALRDGSLAGAAVDVFEEEPLPPESPLWDAPGCLVTPHVAGLTRDYMERVAELFVANLRRLDAGEPLHNEIDPRRGY
jgi:phosphoglycerate dehydrogenase-like enzyme